MRRPSLSPPELSTWPNPEYWTGIVFNGNKIGFSHLKIGPDATKPGLYRIDSEAALRFHFLTVDKQVKLVSLDRVNPDLTLNSFSYDYDLDGNQMKLFGAVSNGILSLIIDSASGEVTETYPLAKSLYPMSAVNLYPVLHGLKVGAEYEFDVFDGESQRLAVVRQRIEAYEKSELFEGEAWKVKTRMHGQEVTTWINAKGEPVLEISMNGVFIAGLETEAQARQYLAQAALNKDETLLNFSLIKTDVPIPSPRSTTMMEIELTGISGIEELPNDARQRCAYEAGVLRCRIEVVSVPTEPLDAEQLKKYMASSIPVPHGHPLIREVMLGMDGLQPDMSDTLRVNTLLDWLGKNIKPEAVDVFSALEVLESKKAECQGYSFLFASFARALGIPTRVVNGLVYSEQYPGFLYHTWVESLIDGQWQAIDPTFGQLQADATHIKLVEGENLADLTPLLNLLGRISAKVVAVGT